MKTLVKPQPKLGIVSFNNKTDHLQDQLSTLRKVLDFKFYQKLFLVFFALSIFLIFPESPKDSHTVCNKHYSKEVCNIW